MELGSCSYVVRRFRDGSDVSKQIYGCCNNSLVLCGTGGSCIFPVFNGKADEMADQSLYDLQVVYGPTILLLSLRLPYRLP